MVHGEKGIMVFDLVYSFGKMKKSGYRLLRMDGGTAPNMVPDRAEAVIDAGPEAETLTAYAAQYAENTGFDIRAQADGSLVTLISVGTAAHGAMPWKGRNAVSQLLQMLAALEFHSEEI